MRMLCLGLLCWLLAGCAQHAVDQYVQEQPALDLPAYFNGEVQAWGMFQNRSGEVLKRFHVALTGRWQGDVGTMALPNGGSGPCAVSPMAAGAARPPMCWAKRWERSPAMLCTGVTSCCSRLMAAPMWWTSTTGCSCLISA